MAHHTLRSGYGNLIERLNRFPQGAPPSDLLYKILKLLFSEKEADLVSRLPIRPFTAKKASSIWKLREVDTRKILEQLASRAILMDIEKNGEVIYTLPPPMAGFFEFSLMRVRGDIDQKLLSELYFQYLNMEEEFVRDLFANGETQLGRAFVNEPSLPDTLRLEVLDYESASEVIKTASHRGIGVCYCRHKMDHMNRSCQAPMEICMTFNNTAASLIRHKYARLVDTEEALDLLQLAQSKQLVQFGENVQNNVSFICNCCGCCCEALIAHRRFSTMHPVHTTNYIPFISSDNCNGCGKCVEACPVEAILLVSTNRPDKPKMKKAKLDQDICIGCGVCKSSCRADALELKRRSKRVITPLTTAHRAVLMALERGKLQNLVFENQFLASHRAMAAILGVILKLPPLKQALATQQFKSRYLVRLLEFARA
jgi:ferredoxin